MIIWNTGLLAAGEGQTQTDACKNLWGEVLIRALEDAQGRFGSSNDNRQPRPTIQAQAIIWIGSRDFHDVCDAAGVCPDAVKHRFHAGKSTRR